MDPLGSDTFSASDRAALSISMGKRLSEAATERGTISTSKLARDIGFQESKGTEKIDTGPAAGRL